MNIVRDGVLLIVYEFIVILCFIFLSNPVALTIAAITDAGTASGVTQMTYYQTLINHVLSICFILAGLIPLIIFVYLAFTTNQEEYLY